MNTPDWEFWKHMPEAKPWEACALALNIDPDFLKKDPYPESNNPYSHDDNPSSMLLSYDIAAKFEKLKRLFRRHRNTGSHFSLDTRLRINGTIRLDEFAAWCLAMNYDIPQELANMTKPKAQTIPVTIAQASLTKASSIEIEPDADEGLAALFDNVPVAALEKMFPANGKWKDWASRAKQNGLIKARLDRARFNPYYAAMWFLARGEEGWDISRCNKKLAANLPPRSRDKEHLFTEYLE